MSFQTLLRRNLRKVRAATDNFFSRPIFFLRREFRLRRLRTEASQRKRTKRKNSGWEGSCAQIVSVIETSLLAGPATYAVGLYDRFARHELLNCTVFLELLFWNEVTGAR